MKRKQKAKQQALNNPQKYTGPQVFAGVDHALILRPNGDLYAIGNNRNGCLGDNQRAELMQFTRIAFNVAHAAAGHNHTLYVDREGKVTVLGRSEYAEQFQCDFPVKRVFAHPYYDAFLLEDLQGDLHFFGERKTTNCVEWVTTELQTLPRICVRQKTDSIWDYCHLEYHSWCSQYRYETTILSGTTDIQKNPEIQQIMGSDWYRELLQEYGEYNVLIHVGDYVETKSVSRKSIPNGSSPSNYECVEDYFYEPTVYHCNKRIYKPTLCREERRRITGKLVLGCWPDLIGWDDQELENTVKIFDSYPDYMNEILKISLDIPGTVTFHSESFTHDPNVRLTGIADLAVSPFNTNSFCKDLILVATKTGEVYYGLRNQLEEASRIRTGLHILKKRPNLWNMMKKVDFSSI